MRAAKGPMCLWILATLLVGGVALGWESPAVQGVIDWKGETRPSPKIDFLQDVHEQGWDVANGDLAKHAAMDRTIFMPHALQKVGDSVTFRNLTVAVLTQNCSVSCVTVWYWGDVNNNGIADEDDKILVNNQLTPQSWKELVHLGSPIPENTAFNLFGGIAQGSGNMLRSGLSYLLLIEVITDNPPLDSYSFAGAIDTSEFPAVTIKDAGPATTSWGQQGVPAWGDLEGHAVPPGRWDGIDNREILWIRVNQPPPSPGPRGSGGR